VRVAVGVLPGPTEASCMQEQHAKSKLGCLGRHDTRDRVVGPPRLRKVMLCKTHHGRMHREHPTPTTLTGHPNC
jgi:hypothetical protein